MRFFPAVFSLITGKIPLEEFFMRKTRRQNKVKQKDPMDKMPLELVMKLEVRCDALAEYNKLSEDKKEELRRQAANASSREETERIIDGIASGRYYG